MLYYQNYISEKLYISLFRITHMRTSYTTIKIVYLKDFLSGYQKLNLSGFFINNSLLLV